MIVGVSSEGIARAWVVSVEDRVTLLEGVELTTDVLSECPTRAGEVLLEGAVLVLSWTPADCFSSSYQHGRLTNSERGKGEDTGCKCALRTHVEWRKKNPDMKQSGIIQLSSTRRAQVDAEALAWRSLLQLT